MITVREYKITDNKQVVYYIWGKDADDAFFNIARKLNPNVVSTQWTGSEKEINQEEYDKLVQAQLSSTC